MSEELKPCPWCKGTELSLSERSHNNVMLVCENNNCRAEGPWAKIEGDADPYTIALKAWNTRPAKNLEKLADDKAEKIIEWITIADSNEESHHTIKKVISGLILKALKQEVQS